MAEPDPTPTPSEPDPADADASGGGTGDDGGAGGTAAADKLAAERDAAEQRARSFQADRDKARREADELKAELAKAKGASGDETPAPSGLSEEQVRQVMRRESARTRELAAAVETARSEFPNADPSVYSDTDSYETAEEFLTAAKASHDRLAGHLADREKEIEEEVRKRYAEKFGELPAPPEDPGKGQGAGDPTVEQLSSMSQAQLDQLEKDKPGVIDRVLRSADQL